MMKLVPAPVPISITSIAPANATNVTSTWTGGAGPFVLQKKSSLTDRTWINHAITPLDSATVHQDRPTGFIRIRDAAHEPPSVSEHGPVMK